MVTKEEIVEYIKENYPEAPAEYLANKVMQVLEAGVIPDYTETHALGDGEWSIENYSYEYGFIYEVVGSNGQKYDEEPDDLWFWTQVVDDTALYFMKNNN